MNNKLLSTKLRELRKLHNFICTLFVYYLGKDTLLTPGCEPGNKRFQELLKKASLYQSDKL